LKFFKSIINLPKSEHLKHFKILDSELNKLKDDPYEKRPFLYLNFPAWVTGKIRHKTMTEIIKEQNLALI